MADTMRAVLMIALAQCQAGCDAPRVPRLRFTLRQSSVSLPRRHQATAPQRPDTRARRHDRHARRRQPTCYGQIVNRRSRVLVNRPRIACTAESSDTSSALDSSS